MREEACEACKGTGQQWDGFCAACEGIGEGGDISGASSGSSSSSCPAKKKSAGGACPAEELGNSLARLSLARVYKKVIGDDLLGEDLDNSLGRLSLSRAEGEPPEAASGSGYGEADAQELPDDNASINARPAQGASEISRNAEHEVLQFQPPARDPSSATAPGTENVPAAAPAAAGNQAIGDGNDMSARYERLENIGEGVYGTVFKARQRSSGRLVAAKQLRLEDEFINEGIPAYVLREVGLLQNFDHPNIIKLLDVELVDRSEFRLYFELLEIDLHQVLKSFRKAQKMMPMERVRRYSRELTNGIFACHMRLILHRDLKPQNILIGPGPEGQDCLKIADFGLARSFNIPTRAYTHDVVTLWYRAPEILLGCQNYGVEVDMWSAGCIITEMATCLPIFPGDSEIGTIFKIFQLLGTPSEAVWPDLRRTCDNFKSTFPKWPPTELLPVQRSRPDLGATGLELLRSLLVMNPAVRLSARRAKNHVFCAEAVQQ